MKSNSFDVEVSSLHILDCPLPDLFTGRTGPPQKTIKFLGSYLRDRFADARRFLIEL